MAETLYDFDPHNLVDQKHGYYVFIGTILGFGVLNLIVTHVGKPKTVDGDPWRWNNLVISWIHALVCGIWVIISLILYPELLDDLMYHKNYCTYFLVAFSTGYFIYDILDLVFRKKVIDQWEVTAHHIAVASMFWINFHCKMIIAFNIIALMTEINSFFLHSRKLLHMLKFRFTNQFYRCVCWLNLLTFVFRFYGSAKIVYAISYEYVNVQVWYTAMITLSMSAMVPINVVLFLRLFKSDVLRNLNSKKKSKEEKVKEEKTQILLNGNNNQTNHVKLE